MEKRVRMDRKELKEREGMTCSMHTHLGIKPVFTVGHQIATELLLAISWKERRIEGENDWGRFGMQPSSLARGRVFGEG